MDVGALSGGRQGRPWGRLVAPPTDVAPRHRLSVKTEVNHLHLCIVHDRRP